MSELLSRKILIRGEPAAEGPTLCCAVLCYATLRRGSRSVLSHWNILSRELKSSAEIEVWSWKWDDNDILSCYTYTNKYQHIFNKHVCKNAPNANSASIRPLIFAVVQRLHAEYDTIATLIIRRSQTHLFSPQVKAESRSSAPQTEGAECCNASNIQQGATMVFRLCFFLNLWF